MTSTANYELLRDWLHNPRNKTLWNESLIDVKPSPLGGLGVFARESIKIEEKEEDEDEDDDDETGLLLRISKSSILSPRNSCISNLLEEAELEGMIAIILAFLYEREAGESSPWYGYLQSITYHDNKKKIRQPFGFWDEKILKTLKETSAGLHIEENVKTVHTMYKTSIDFAQKYKTVLDPPEELRFASDSTKYKSEEFYSPLFGAAFAAVLSRAFDVDNYHGLSLVPGADLFNHHQEGDEDVHFISIGEVCEFCGKPSGCHHQDPWDAMDVDESEVEGSDNEGDESGEEMEGDAESDEGQENNEESEGEEEEEEEEEELTEITEEYIKKIEEQLRQEEEEEGDDDEEESEDGEGESEDEDDDYPSEIEDEFGIIPLNELEYDADECCDIKLSRSVKRGQEIFNTYGYLEPVECLVRYGFVTPSNQFTSVSHHFLKMTKGYETFKEDEYEDSKGRPNAREFKRRLDWWIEEGRMKFLDANEEFAQMILLGNKVESELPYKVVKQLYEETNWKNRVVIGTETCSFEAMVLASMASMSMEDYYDGEKPSERIFNVENLEESLENTRNQVLKKILKDQKDSLAASLAKLRSAVPKSDERLQAESLIKVEMKSLCKDVSQLQTSYELYDSEMSDTSSM